MSSVVVTGASGFIGRHLCSRLSASGATVIAVSRKHKEGFKYVTDYEHSPCGDILIHLGEEPDRGRVNKSGIAYQRESARVLTGLTKRRYSRLIYISSGAVYGDQRQQPSNPRDSVVASDIYNRTKLINENIVLEAGGVVARLSNIYGRGMAANNVISDIVAQVSSQGPLKVRDETPVCDYLHVGDLVEAMTLLAFSDYVGVINIATGVGSTVRRLAEIVLSATGQATREIASTNMKRNSISVNVLDITETKTILGWRPRIDLVDGLSGLVSNTPRFNHGK